MPATFSALDLSRSSQTATTSNQVTVVTKRKLECSVPSPALTLLRAASALLMDLMIMGDALKCALVATGVLSARDSGVLRMPL